MGNCGLISLARLATSQPSILPRRLMSLTSARYLVKPPCSNVTASSPDAAIAGSKPPSLRAISTMFCSDWSSSTTKITGKSSKAVRSPTKSSHTSRGSLDFVPDQCAKVNLAEPLSSPGAGPKWGARSMTDVPPNRGKPVDDGYRCELCGTDPSKVLPDSTAETKPDHFLKCPACGQWFDKGRGPERTA